LDNLIGYSDAAYLDSLDDRLTAASERRRRIFPDFQNQRPELNLLFVNFFKSTNLGVSTGKD